MNSKLDPRIQFKNKDLSEIRISLALNKSYKFDNKSVIINMFSILRIKNISLLGNGLYENGQT